MGTIIAREKSNFPNIFRRHNLYINQITNAILCANEHTYRYYLLGANWNVDSRSLYVLITISPVSIITIQNKIIHNRVRCCSFPLSEFVNVARISFWRINSVFTITAVAYEMQ